MKTKNKNKNSRNNNNKPVNNSEYIKDESPIIPQRNKLKGNLTIFKRDDLTVNQKKFLELAKDKNTKIIFVNGPAGTSKTFLSVMSALQLLNEKKVSDLIYLRSVVESSDKSMGYLPGTSDEKLCPYIQPLMDKLEELLPRHDIELLVKEQRVQGHPINFLRGLSWNAKTIILDEAQNCTYKELFTFITRIGEFSKVFILGDPKQSDINGKSGFIKIMDMFNEEIDKLNGIQTFTFTKEDVVRSGLVRYIIDKVEKIELENAQKIK